MDRAGRKIRLNKSVKKESDYGKINSKDRIYAGCR